MTFAQKLELMIDVRRMSQTRLSRLTGIGQPAISAMTRGERRPYLDQAFRLARALDVSVDYLADDSLAQPEPVPTERERTVWEILRAIGYERALLRLVAPGDDGLRLVEPTPATPPRLRQDGTGQAG